MEIELGNREIAEGKYSRSKYYKKSENLTLRHFFCEAKNHLAGYGSVFLSSDAHNSDYEVKFLAENFPKSTTPKLLLIAYIRNRNIL